MVEVKEKKALEENSPSQEGVDICFVADVGRSTQRRRGQIPQILVRSFTNSAFYTDTLSSP